MVLLFIACSEDSTTTSPENIEPEDMEGMVLIPSKDISFSMGSENGRSDELPVHTVNFTYNFWIDSTEVTQKQYDDVMSQSYQNYLKPEWHDPYGYGDNYPCYTIYWEDAVLYCNALSIQNGYDTVYTYSSITGSPGRFCQLNDLSSDLSKNGYRLPTEAEWEFACRAGSVTDFFWNKNMESYPETSQDSSEVSSHTVWYANSWDYGADDNRFGTHQVASNNPNAFGLFDMSGNVYEWCHDWYGAYQAGSATDPSGPISGDWHIVRGGSWGNHSNFLTSANRTFNVPAYQYYFLGFRTVIPEQN